MREEYDEWVSQSYAANFQTEIEARPNARDWYV